MEAADNAMNLCLARIGFNQPAVLAIRSYGIMNAEGFRMISYQLMAQFIETSVATRVPPPFPPAPVVGGNQTSQAAADHEVAAAARPIFMPYTALWGNKALRA
jgi:hypothetical protein